MTMKRLRVFAAALFALLAAARADDSSYAVTVLGDLHYDAAPVDRFHDTNRFTKAKFSTFNRVTNMWKEEIMGVLEASAKCVGMNTAFVLQLGDLIDGNSGSYDCHTQFLAAATAVLEGVYGGLPLISVCGNHDIWGNAGSPKVDRFDGGASGAYRDFMVPWQSRQVARLTTNAVTSTTFGFRHGPDMWVFIDFNEGARTVETVKRLLADNPGTRYTFVAIHAPVLPMDLWKIRWFYLGWEHYDRQRREIRELLAKREAIVLSGHAHTLEYKDWYGDGGRITEMVVNSVPRYPNGKPKSAEPRVLTEATDDYGTWLAKKPPSEGNERYNALYEEYRPGLKSRYGASAVGHCILRVSDSGVALEYYGRDATTPTKTFTLR